MELEYTTCFRIHICVFLLCKSPYLTVQEVQEVQLVQQFQGVQE